MYTDVNTNISDASLSNNVIERNPNIQIQWHSLYGIFKQL